MTADEKALTLSGIELLRFPEWFNSELRAVVFNDDGSCNYLWGHKALSIRFESVDSCAAMLLEGFRKERGK